MAKYTLDNLPIDKDQYKVIALDLDDTLLRSDKTISDYTVKTLKKAQSQGYSIVIATGRHPKSAVRYMQMLDCLNDNSACISSFVHSELSGLTGGTCRNITKNSFYSCQN